MICHNGNTIRVSDKAASAHLDQHSADSYGPCSVDRVICRNGKTRVVDSGYNGNADYEGPCTNQTFMCSLRNRIITVNADAVADHVARGQLLGLCPGKSLICHNGRTIIVSASARQSPKYQNDPDGYCLGGPGPVITDNPPTSASR